LIVGCAVISIRCDSGGRNLFYFLHISKDSSSLLVPRRSFGMTRLCHFDRREKSFSNHQEHSVGAKDVCRDAQFGRLYKRRSSGMTDTLVIFSRFGRGGLIVCDFSFFHTEFFSFFISGFLRPISFVVVLVHVSFPICFIPFVIVFVQ